MNHNDSFSPSRYDFTPASFVDLMSLEQHVELKHPADLVCPHCNQIFSDDQDSFQVGGLKARYKDSS